jgi:hypothetical protein
MYQIKPCTPRIYKFKTLDELGDGTVTISYPFTLRYMPEQNQISLFDFAILYNLPLEVFLSKKRGHSSPWLF